MHAYGQARQKYDDDMKAFAEATAPAAAPAAATTDAATTAAAASAVTAAADGTPETIDGDMDAEVLAAIQASMADSTLAVPPSALAIDNGSGTSVGDGAQAGAGAPGPVQVPSRLSVDPETRGDVFVTLIAALDALALRYDPEGRHCPEGESTNFAAVVGDIRAAPRRVSCCLRWDSIPCVFV